MTTKNAVIVLALACVIRYGENLKPALGADSGARCCYLRVTPEHPVMLGRPFRWDSEKEFNMYKGTQQCFVTNRFVLSAALRNRDVSQLQVVQAEQKKGDPVLWLESVIKVSFPGNAELMEVVCKLGNPRGAVTLTNAVVDAYLTEFLNCENVVRGERIDSLDQIVVEKETELRT
jgi:hypothetical protein